MKHESCYGDINVVQDKQSLDYHILFHMKITTSSITRFYIYCEELEIMYEREDDMNSCCLVYLGILCYSTDHCPD